MQNLFALGATRDQQDHQHATPALSDFCIPYWSAFVNEKVADVIVKILEQAGVRHCYGIVGDTLNRMAEAIFQSEIGWVSVRHEEAGAFAAAGEALATGHLTAVAGSCGAGGLHFLNGLYDANRNRAPVVLIATQITRRELGFDFMQEVDFKEVYRGCSVYCDMIFTPDQAIRKTVIACQAAMAKQGVAVLIVPVDISISDHQGEPLRKVHYSLPVTRPNDEEIDCIAQALNKGGNIAIYGGYGCHGAHSEIMTVAALLNAPVAHTASAKQFLEPDNRYDIGMTGILGTEAGYHAVLECDTLLLLGADFAWSQYYPTDATIIQLDAEATHLGRRHPVTMGYIGDVKATLKALAPRLRQQDDTSFRDRYVQRYRHAQKAMRDQAVPGGDGGIPANYLTRLIDVFAADNADFAADDGTPTAWMYRLITANGRRRLYASLLHGTMASGLPTAIGLQRSQPGRQVIALCGDGGLSMLLGELLTTVQEDLPIKIVVYDNGKLGFAEIEQKAEGMIPRYTALKNPDFGKVAEAIGLWGRSVTRADELEEAIRAWLAQPGPALLNVRISPMFMVMPTFLDTEAAYGMALYSTRAVLQGMGGDVWELIRENFL
jgi:pyruvate dehydrogenase (quinone)